MLKRSHQDLERANVWSSHLCSICICFWAILLWSDCSLGHSMLFSAKNSKLFRFLSLSTILQHKNVSPKLLPLPQLRNKSIRQNFETLKVPGFSCWVRIVHVLLHAEKLALHSSWDKTPSDSQAEVHPLHPFPWLSLVSIFQISLGTDAFYASWIKYQNLEGYYFVGHLCWEALKVFCNIKYTCVCMAMHKLTHMQAHTTLYTHAYTYTQ